MKVVNLYGGPGAGKSTTRAGLFYKMKMAQLVVEETPEYAKDLTYEKNWTALTNQWLVIGEQNHRLNRLRGQVDYAVTDSPLPLGLMFATPAFQTEWFTDAVWGLYDTYDNVNIFIERAKPYQKFGRNQSEDEARLIDRKLRHLMRDRIDLYVPGDENASDRIMGFLGL
ncbi:thymidylate kinase [Caulobacter phage CcrBL9]|uniref:NadR/Ttd14 AAA domain-containing protein n=1 Tax=Caulobacter phage CcrBL9 TaxID=2283270 RepID=A0A385EBU5_9CAUD|nr:thymidylate kinase [Caulobacter phage CcrBL9]AXQ69166.1 hypothetical protein CcrBL9_gp142 [Caulobacter phage CcrBL9]